MRRSKVERSKVKLRRSLQPFNIGQVLESAGQAFVANEVRTPTMRKRTSVAMNARNRSRKSGFIAGGRRSRPLFLTEAPDFKDALGVRHLEPEREIVLVGFGG